ncbi:MAG: TonB-dependent receptor [Candidatus Aminicenantes bacterium]
MKNRLLVFIMLIMACIVGAFALPEKSENEQKKKEKSDFHPHEEVVVTATATRKAVQDCSAAVSVVRAEDIKAVWASNALNLLGVLPGIFIQRTGDFGRADVGIRGIGQRGRRITILIDGRPEKMGLYGCTITHAFPVDNVERIEVVRGPSSVLYGSEAMGGVVNILTRTPEEGFETDFSASYGSFNTHQLNLRHGGKLGKFGYYFTLDRRKSDGHRQNSGYKGTALTGKLNYNFSSHFQLIFQGKYFKGNKHEAGPLSLPLYEYWNDYERGAVDLTLKGKGKSDEFYLKVYRNFGHHQFSDGWHSRDYVNGGIFRCTSRMFQNNELTLGADYRMLGGKSYNWPKGSWTKNETALFIQDEYVLKRRWILSAGLRLHRDSLYGLEVCPHWGVVFKASEKTTLRGAVNKGFRSPQLNELYMFPPANPDLEPERMWNFEVGWQQEISPGLSVGGAVFRMRGSNFIATGFNPSPPPEFKFLNTGEFTFWGAELDLRADICESLTASLFYTYLDPGEKTRGRAGQKWDFALRFQKNSIFASLRGQYVRDYFAGDFSRSPLPSYFLLNSRMDIKILSFADLLLDVNNILNTDYQIYVDLPGMAAGVYPMPARSFNVGLRIKQ